MAIIDQFVPAGKANSKSTEANSKANKADSVSLLAVNSDAAVRAPAANFLMDRINSLQVQVNALTARLVAIEAADDPKPGGKAAYMRAYMREYRKRTKPHE